MSARTLKKKADALHAAEIERWKAAWEDYMASAGRFLQNEIHRLHEGTQASRLARRLARHIQAFWALPWSEDERRGDPEGAATVAAVDAVWAREASAERASEDPSMLPAWEAWGEAFFQHRDALFGSPDLTRWPDGLPVPPERPTDLERYLASFAAAEDDTPEAYFFAQAIETEAEAVYVFDWKPKNAEPNRR